MVALKEKSDKELAQYNLELKEIKRILEHDRKLKEFMNVKAQERELDEESLARKRKKGRLLNDVPFFRRLDLMNVKQNKNEMMKILTDSFIRCC